LVHTRDAFGTAALAARLKRELPPSFAAARVTVEQLESGPPIGTPVQVRLQGPELATLRRLGDEVKSLMRQAPGTENIHDDWDPESLQINLQVAPDRANMTGVTNQDVAMMTNAGLSGYTATTLRERDRQVPVVLRLRPDERSRMEDMKTLQVFSSRAGTQVPLEQVGSFRTEMVSPKIGRRDNERCLTVKCDTVPGVLPSGVADRLESALVEASKSWPPGYRFAFGGEKEEQAKGFAFMMTAMVASILGIYLALVLQFNSLTKPLLVFAAVPFGMIGGMMGLLIFNVPLGFFALLGLSSLAGVIISHVIVLFEYIEEAHERGEPLRRAVIDAALVRLRPVLVTVLATVGGLVPLAMKGGPLWEPLCCVQIIGLLVATLVTKVVVPVLYVLFVEDFKLIKWAAPGEHVAEGPPAEYLNLGHHQAAPPIVAHPS
jgi:multidrug efflux pump subunit AcrB